VSLFDFVLRIIRNLYALIFYALPKVLTGIIFRGRSAIALLLSVVTGVGFLRCIRKKATLIEWYVFFYIIIYLLWPWFHITGARFLVPLIPFMFYYFLCGIDAFLELKALNKYKRILFCLVVCLIIAVNVFSLVFHIRNVFYKNITKDTSDIHNFIELSSWLKTHTPPDAVIMSHPKALPSLYLWSKRKGVFIESVDMPHRVEHILSDRERVISIICHSKVDYLVVFHSLFESEVMRTCVSLIADILSPLYNKRGNVIYAIDKEKINQAVLKRTSKPFR